MLENRQLYNLPHIPKIVEKYSSQIKIITEKRLIHYYVDRGIEDFCVSVNSLLRNRECEMACKETIFNAIDLSRASGI